MNHWLVASVLVVSVLFAMCIGGCKSDATPTLTIEEEIATEVGKKRAVAATLTAAAPTLPPSPTSTSSLSPTSPPIPTGHIPTSTPASPFTPRAATRVPSTPLPSAEPPSLREPAQGSEHKSPVTFKWDGTLRAGQSYQVNVYHAESGHTVQSDLLTAQEWTVDLPGEKVGGWHWTVSVVQNETKISNSGEWKFWFQPFPGSGDNGGDDGDDGTPAPTSTTAPYPG